MNLEIHKYVNEELLYRAFQLEESDAYAFGEDGMRRANGYVAYQILGTPEALDMVEEHVKNDVEGSWRIHRFCHKEDFHEMYVELL